MELKPSLFRCAVYHGRVAPVRNEFSYSYFMFLLDITDSSRFPDLRLAGYERMAFYSYRNKDHYSSKVAGTGVSIKLEFKEMGIEAEEIYHLTNLRTAGYQFNPVSFYFAVSARSVIGCIAEVGNTFGEQKLFRLHQMEGQFVCRRSKDFYVSPYSSLKAEFDFKVKFTVNGLDIRISTFEDDKLVLYSRLNGDLINLTDRNILKQTLRFPFVTMKVITLIHWQAFRLWLKKAPYIRKKDFEQSQHGHYKIRK